MVQMTSKSYFKVKNVFIGKYSSTFCLIGSEIKRTRVKSGCASRCSVIPRCSLNCFNESTCLYFDSLVSKYWHLSGNSPGLLHEMSGLFCFSSYHLHEDITDKIINNRGIENPPFKIEHTIDGYYCPGESLKYLSKDYDNPWIELEFDRDYPVREVLVFTSNEDPTRFEAVEVRVGSVSGTDGDFSAQTFFDYYQGMADPEEVVSFQSDVPIKGKFLSIKIIGDNSHLIFTELKVLQK